MPRAKAALIYRPTWNLRAVQLLPGHLKLGSTLRYLGIEVDAALEISEQTEIRLSDQELLSLAMVPHPWPARDPAAAGHLTRRSGLAEPRSEPARHTPRRRMRA